MRIVCVASESPYPPAHGGRVDVWRRYRIMKRLGCALMIVFWARRPPPDEDVRALESVFDLALVERPAAGLAGMAKRLFDLPRYSPHVSSREVSGPALDRAIAAISDFRADALVLEDPYGWLLAREAARLAGLPLFYRSHNIEFKFMRSQSGLSRNVRDRVAFGLASLHLEGLELEIQRRSLAVFDISEDDRQYWRTRGVSNNHWLPVAFEEGDRPCRPWSERAQDVQYLGNLNAPNNVQGLEWFLDRIAGRLYEFKPDLKIGVAGSAPSEAMKGVLSRHPKTIVQFDPPDSSRVLSDARVLINPILAGSGVNVKSAEMLFFDSPVVTTNVGVRGFPEAIREQFLVADEPADFAAAIVAQLAAPSEFFVTSGRRKARETLGPEAVRGALALMEQALATKGRARPVESAYAGR